MLNSAGTEKKGNSVCVDLFTVFSTCDMDKLGKIVDPTEKSALRLVKLPSLKLLKTNEDVASQSHDILQTRVSWWHKLVSNVCKFS